MLQGYRGSTNNRSAPPDAITAEDVRTEWRIVTDEAEDHVSRLSSGLSETERSAMEAMAQLGPSKRTLTAISASSIGPLLVSVTDCLLDVVS